MIRAPLIKEGFLWLMKHQRGVLTGVNIAGSLCAVVFAWNARPKYDEALANLDDDATLGDKFKVLAPIVGPVVAAEAVSIGCGLAHLKVGSDLIATAINTASGAKTMEDIRKEVEKEVVGEEKAAEIDRRTVEQRLASVAEEEIEDTGHGDTLFIDPEFTGRIWRGSKDFFDLCIARLDKKIASAYDTYGRLRYDDVAVTIGDIYREQGLRSATNLDNIEYTARDFQRGLPIKLVPREFTRGGKVELGYEIDYQENPSIVSDDRLINFEHWR